MITSSLALIFRDGKCDSDDRHKKKKYWFQKMTIKRSFQIEAIMELQRVKAR